MKKRTMLLWFPVLFLLPALLGVALSRPAAPTVAPPPEQAPSVRAVAPATASAPHPSQAHPGYAWVLETADPDPSAGTGTSLQLDTQGDPHIAYQQGYLTELRYARLDGSAWLTETVDSFGPTGIEPPWSWTPRTTPTSLTASMETGATSSMPGTMGRPGTPKPPIAGGTPAATPRCGQTARGACTSATTTRQAV